MKSQRFNLVSCSSLFAIILSTVLFNALTATAFAQRENGDIEEITVVCEDCHGGVDVIQIGTFEWGVLTDWFPKLPKILTAPNPPSGDDTPEPEDPCAQLAAEIADLQEQLTNWQDIDNDLDDADGFWNFGLVNPSNEATPWSYYTVKWVTNQSQDFKNLRAGHRAKTIMLEAKLKRKQEKYNKECGGK